IIGLPGDQILVRAGVVTVNGQPLKRRSVSRFELGRELKLPEYVNVFEETTPEGLSYRIAEGWGHSGLMDAGPYVVPPGHCFVMGDSRDNAVDSRTPKERGGVGFVPLENILGPATIRFFQLGLDLE
ncbi:MAG: signal peptidase I, partial [Hyphomicrobiaceae bacterium]